MNKPVTISYDTENEYGIYDPHHVEQMVRAACAAIQHVSIPDLTTPTEILCAAFTILDRTLAATVSAQNPSEQAMNSKEVARVLNELIVEYGQTLN